ncbi:MAG: ATP-binding protein [Lysinibacillus sp.]
MKDNIWFRYGLVLLGSFLVLFIMRLCWMTLFYPIQVEYTDGNHINIDYALIEENELIHLPIDVEDSATSSYDQMMEISFNTIRDETTLMFYIPKSNYKTELFINNKLISYSSNTYGEIYSAYTAEVTINEPNFTIAIASDDNEPNTRLFDKAIIMSSVEGVTNRSEFNNLMNVVILITLLLNIIYSAFIYIFVYRNRIVLLYAVTYMFPFLDELYRFMSSIEDEILISYVVNAKLTPILNLCTAICIVRFGQLLVANKIKYQAPIMLSFGLSFFMLLVSPLAYQGTIELLLLVFYFIAIIYTYKAVWQGTNISEKELYFLLFALTAASSGILWGVIKSQLSYEIPLYPFDYLFIQLGIASFWAYRFYLNVEKEKFYVEELKQANQMKDDFLRRSSERLQNPLNAFIFELEKDEVNLSQLKKTAQMMNFSLGHLFDYMYLQNETIEIKEKPISVVPLLSYLISLLQPYSRSTNIAIVFNNEMKQLYVVGDKQKLSQVLFNLLYTAIIKLKPGSEVTIDIKEDGRRIIICIAEMPMEYWNELDQVTIDICHQLLALQQGKLTFNNGTIEVCLVKSNEKESRYVPLEQLETPIEYKGKALLWSENHADNLLLMTLLSSQHYQLTIANEVDFWSQLQSYQYDLVIIDSLISTHSALDIVEQIRQQFSFVQLPILLITVHAHDLEVSTIFKLGVNDYIVKPIQPLEFISRARSLMMMKQTVENEINLEAELLRAQIEPHFLFNTLNTIASLSTINQEKMIHLLNEFGSYLASLFDARMLNRTVPLSDEIELVKSFAYIQEQRFMPDLEIVWQLKYGPYNDVTIPPFSLQTLVENAIHHGIHPKGDKGTVTISMWRNKQQFFIRVADDGIGIPPDRLATIIEASNGIGLRNTQERIRRSLGGTLQIESVEGQGTSCTISIPI